MQSLAQAGARLLALDVTNDTSMTTAVHTILQEAGRIDVFINNALCNRRWRQSHHIPAQDSF